MSRKYTPQFVDPKGALIEPPGIGTTLAFKAGAPTASVAGYAKGCIFIDVTNGIVYINTGSTTSATWVALTTGATAARQFRGGTLTLDGSNPTTVATGLSTIVAATATLKAAATPGDDPSWVSVNYTGSDGNLDVYAYKNTGGTDPTLVASTNNTATFDWIAIGT